jgi:CRP/FNR family transcriptional regulator
MRHDYLYRPGARLVLLHVVRFGQFKLVGEDSSGQERVAGFYMAGDWMGLDAISIGRHRFGVRALDDAEVIEIDFSAATQMIRGHPQIQQQFLAAFSDALCNEDSDSINSGDSLDWRFAHFLLNLGKKYARLGYSQKSFRLSMSRSDIGCYLGTAAATISRLVARFNSEGVVTILGRNVEVHDLAALDALCSGRGLDSSPAPLISSNAGRP